ncbi:MTH1187 family thiamine-binding protein [Salinactinospora qingdaonensis]|uniref:Thiamine-binding protein n=1 Tax=Salinactinospora qingdaonensis TaxID=702744 RepID=A0ABP7FPI4_9ACTN
MIVAFSVSPMGQGDSVAPAVARAVQVVRESGLPNRTDAMFTSIEGEWDEVMDVVKRAVGAAGEGASRVSLVLKADIREGMVDGLTSKVQAVEEQLTEPDWG